VILAKQIDSESVGFEIKDLTNGTIELEIRDLGGSQKFYLEGAHGYWYTSVRRLRSGTRYEYRVRVQGSSWSEWAELITAGQKERGPLQLVPDEKTSEKKRRRN
jgi:hypothetical protein